MNRATELSFIRELLDLEKRGSFFMSDEVTTAPVTAYSDEARFNAENQHIFRQLPIVAAHTNELPAAGDFVTRMVSGTPVLLTRTASGEAKAFINVCRHRGAELVGQEQGCKRLFSCPYHAWTYTNEGELRNAPHLESGFPGLIKSDYNLTELSSLEREGLIWVIADPHSQRDIEAYVEPVLSGLAWSGMAGLTPVISETFDIGANWKILVEGGIEAYHFKVAHRKTIGPYFLDNLSCYRALGDHSVNVLAKNSLKTLADMPEEAWQVRSHSNVIFSSFPLDSFLLMEDHIAWIHMRPIAAGRTEIRLDLLAPVDRIGEDDMPHWQTNYAITKTTLMEDWTLNEGIQRGIESGANSHYTFGRFESALEAFNKKIESFLPIAS